MKKAIFAFLGLLVVGGAGGFWWFTQWLTPDPPPQTLLVAEDALAMPGTVGLLHADIGHAVRVETVIQGERDVDALLSPVGKTDSLFNVLVAGGIDLRDSVDHLLLALTTDENGLGLATAVLGRFKVERITDLLPQVYEVTPSTAGNASILILSRRRCGDLPRGRPLCAASDGEQDGRRGSDENSRRARAF